MRNLIIFCVALAFTACHPADKTDSASPSIRVLGNVQDGGSPHIGCTKDCCRDLFLHPDPERKVVSLGILDPQNKKSYLIEATPDITFQMKNLKVHSPFSSKETPDGILASHAHTGHYTGLMYLGREAMNADHVDVFAMPRMTGFLNYSGPWSQLIALGNISLHTWSAGKKVTLTSNISVTPLRVPHRDEFSETVGYLIEGPSKKALFIPDIDKWDKWQTDIIQAIAGVDYAFIDGTFYDGDELPGRDMSEIPHPFIVETMALFKDIPDAEKNKIYFIHLNHTNPALNTKSKQTKTILRNGFHVARMNQIFKL